LGALSVQTAGVLEPAQIAAVAALAGLDSIESLAEGVAEMHELQMALPGALQWFDEADLAAALAPRPVFVSDVRNKAGQATEAEQLSQIYEWTERRYHQAGVTSGWRLSRGPVSAADLADWIRSAASDPPAMR